MINKFFSGELTEKKMITFIFLYVFFLLLACSHMSPLYYSNEWADVNVYFTIGKSIFNGRTLYTEVFDHKGPFIFFLYGFGYLISNHSFFGMFLIELGGWFLMVYSLYRLASLYLGKAGSCLAACVLPILLIKIMKAGGSAEEFILVFQCVSFYLFVKYFKEKNAAAHNPYAMLVHGIISAIVLFTKINLCLIWFFPLAGIFLNLLLCKEYKNFALNVLSFIAGFLIVTIPIIGYLYANNALEEAYNIYILLNKRYAEEGSDGFAQLLISTLYKTLYLYLQPLALCVLAPAGVIYFPIKHIKNKIGMWAFILAGIFSFLLVYMPTAFQYYYPIPLLLFSFLGVLSICLFVGKYINFNRKISPKVVLILLVVCVYTGYNQTTMTETRAAGMLVEDPGIMMKGIQREILKEKDPTLLNLSFGLANSLFTTCEIVPNIRYFLSPNLSYEIYPQMRDEQTKYIEEKRIKFIVMSIPTGLGSVSKVSKKRDKDVETYNYFRSLPAFENNYSLIKMDTLENTIDENSYDIYALYKLK